MKFCRRRSAHLIPQTRDFRGRTSADSYREFPANS